MGAAVPLDSCVSVVASLALRSISSGLSKVGIISFDLCLIIFLSVRNQ